MYKYVIWIWLWLVLDSGSAVWSLETAWQTNLQTEHRLISEFTAVTKGQEFYLGFHIKLKPGWHSYWSNPGDAGFAPQVDYSLSQGIESIELLYPVPNRYELGGGLLAFGYEGEVVYPIRVKISPNAEKVKIHFKIHFLVCEKTCVPYQVEHVLDLSVTQAAEVDVENQKSMQYWLEQLPLDWQSQVTILEEKIDVVGDQSVFQLHLKTELGRAFRDVDIFFNTHSEIAFKKPEIVLLDNQQVQIQVPIQYADSNTNRIKQPISYVVKGLWLNKQEKSFQRIFDPSSPVSLDKVASEHSGNTPNWFLMLMFGLLGGFLLNFMPCVLPVLSIKVFGFLKDLKADPYQVRVGAWMTVLGILVSFGFLAGGLILAKLGGAVVGWGIQFQEPVFITFLSLVVFVFAMNLFGFFEIQLPSRFNVAIASAAQGTGHSSLLSHFVYGLFATLLATPCSAPFLGTAIGFAFLQSNLGLLLIFLSIGLGLAIPYILMALYPHILKFFPKPGEWMNQLRIVLGFVLLASLIWLLFVLANQVDSVGLAFIELILIGLGFLFWLKHLTYGKSWWQNSILVFILFFSAGTIYLAHTSRSSNIANNIKLQHSKDEISWEVFSEEKLNAYLKEGKTVFVDVTADWCFTCKFNEKLVLKDKNIIKLFQDKHIKALKADWTRKDPMIGQYLASFQKRGIPFYVLYKKGQAPEVFSEILTVGLVREKLLAL